MGGWKVQSSAQTEGIPIAQRFPLQGQGTEEDGYSPLYGSFRGEMNAAVPSLNRLQVAAPHLLVGMEGFHERLL